MEQIQPLSCVPEGQAERHDLPDLGKTFKNQDEEEEKQTVSERPFSFSFCCMTGKDVRSSGGKGLKERQGTLPPPQRLLTLLLNQVEVFRQDCIIDYKC